MKTLKKLWILPLLLLISCSGIKVLSDYDKTVDFTKFKTYSYHGWADNSDKIMTPFDKERVEQAFADEFNKRGLKYVKENGDLIVVLHIVTEQKQQTTASTTSTGVGYGGYGGYGGYYGYGPGWGWGGGMGTSTTTYSTYDYTVGTLVVDVYDAAAKKLIWESSGSGTIDDNPQTRDKNIPKAVAAIMQPYPVAPLEKN